jgi:hypothetical protein
MPHASSVQQVLGGNQVSFPPSFLSDGVGQVDTEDIGEPDQVLEYVG